MPLKKGQSNSGINNLIPFPKGKSGFPHEEREVSCVVCGNLFKTTGTLAKYCSLSCKEKSRPDKQKKSFICEFCGAPFKRRAFNNMGRFCSRECSGLWSTANGEISYFYKAFLYLENKCNRCGEKDFTVLVVHHRNKDRTDNSINNLEILCSNCHYKIHFGNGKTRQLRLAKIRNYFGRSKINVSLA